MNEIKKFGLVSKSDTGGREAPSAEVMAAINALTLRPLAPEEVFTFRVAACDDQIDRDFERFSEAALAEMAELYVGKSMLFDHAWSGHNQTARVFSAAVEKNGEVSRLVLSAYMLRGAAADDTIAAIEGGILKEVSVAVAVPEALCSVCGTDWRKAWCEHVKGVAYGGEVCCAILNHVTDVYELSFVAVPAQRSAGVIKAYGGEENRPASPPPEDDSAAKRALALLELEEQTIKNL